MKKLTFLTISLLTLIASSAQSDSTKPEELLTPPDSKTKPGYQQPVAPVVQIRDIPREKGNSILKGGLIGFGIGAATGITCGLAAGTTVSDHFYMTAKQKAIIGGAVFGVTGAITGIIFGALTKKKFTIGQSKKHASRDLQAELMLRLVQK